MLHSGRRIPLVALMGTKLKELKLYLLLVQHKLRTLEQDFSLTLPNLSTT